MEDKNFQRNNTLQILLGNISNLLRQALAQMQRICKLQTVLSTQTVRLDDERYAHSGTGKNEEVLQAADG